MINKTNAVKIAIEFPFSPRNPKTSNEPPDNLEIFEAGALIIHSKPKITETAITPSCHDVNGTLLSVSFFANSSTSF